MDANLESELDVRKRICDRLHIPMVPAVWLRPESCCTVARAVSKTGGEIAWPPSVPWPVCDEQDWMMNDLASQNDSHVSAAQFLKMDFPEICFPPGSDILQVLWCPRYHKDRRSGSIRGPNVKAFWHATDDLREVPNPQPKCADEYMIPNECLFRPIRLDDIPAVEEWTH